jgi:hypothetical protein
MTSMNPVEPRKVDEEQLYQAQPMVRALIIERYEALYRLVTVHVARAEEEGRPPDPRWAEIGVRVLKELTSLYRLATPPRTDAEEDDVLHGVDPRPSCSPSWMSLRPRLGADCSDRRGAPWSVSQSRPGTYPSQGRNLGGKGGQVFKVPTIENSIDRPKPLSLSIFLGRYSQRSSPFLLSVLLPGQRLAKRSSKGGKPSWDPAPCLRGTYPGRMRGWKK